MQCNVSLLNLHSSLITIRFNMTPRRHLSDAEIALLSSTGDKRFNLLITIGCATGFRISELLSLRIADVYANGALLSHVTVDKIHMKGRKHSRTVKLNSKAAASISQYLEGRSFAPSDFLFQSRQGHNKALSACQAWRIIRSLCKKHNIEGNVGTHSFRKTFAVNIYRASSHNIRLTQVALGHRDIQVTTRYLGVCSGEVDDAVDKI
jgi:integrase